MTLVEMLIALGVLGMVIVAATSGIFQSLLVNRLQEDATNTQSKLRRVTEIVSQELRSAVLGTVSDYPASSGEQSVSFTLLSGDGGIVVEPSPGNAWGNSSVTYVYASDREVVDALVGGPAVLVNGRGEAVFIPEIHNVGGSWSGSGSGNGPNVVHPGCAIPIDYTPNTRLYSVFALGFRYSPDEQILYQASYGKDGLVEEPMAFRLTDFKLGYEYSSNAGTFVESEPRRDANGAPQPEVEDGGTTYELTRLHLSMEAEAGDVGREYTTFIELSGLGNEARPIISMVECAQSSGGGPGNGGSEPGGGNDGGGDNGGGNDGGSNDGGGNNGGGNDGGGNNGGGNDGGGNNGGGNDGGGGPPWYCLILPFLCR